MILTLLKEDKERDQEYQSAVLLAQKQKNEENGGDSEGDGADQGRKGANCSEATRAQSRDDDAAVSVPTRASAGAGAGAGTDVAAAGLL